MILSIIITLGLVLIDQITKILANFLLANSNDTVVVLKYILEFELHFNSGASFGMLQGAQWLFMIITLISLLIFGYFFTSIDIKNKKVYSISIMLLIAGTLGNAIDRLRMGKVIDFIHMPILHSFNIIPSFIFNFADIYLNFGIVLFVIDLIFLSKEKKEVDLIDQNN